MRDAFKGPKLTYLHVTAQTLQTVKNIQIHQRMLQLLPLRERACIVFVEKDIHHNSFLEIQ
jgi:hypothetical protein